MTSEATSEKPKRANGANGLIPDFGTWMDGGNRILESWTQSNSAMMKGGLEFAQEMLAFSQARLQADIDSWRALTACRNPGDLFECQKDYTQKATAQYLDEANKLTTRMFGVISGATTPFREQVTKR